MLALDVSELFAFILADLFAADFQHMIKSGKRNAWNELSETMMGFKEYRDKVRRFSLPEEAIDNGEKLILLVEEIARRSM